MSHDLDKHTFSPSQVEQLAEDCLRWYFQQTVPQQLPPLSWLPYHSSRLDLERQQKLTPQATRSSQATDPSPAVLQARCVPSQAHTRSPDNLTATFAGTTLRCTGATSYSRFALLVAICLFALALLFAPWQPPRSFRFPTHPGDGQARDKPALVPHGNRPAPDQLLPGPDPLMPYRSPPSNLPR